MNDIAPSRPGWYQTPNGLMWWTGTEWDPSMRPAKENRPAVWSVYLLGLLLAPAGAIGATIQASKAKKLKFSTARYWVAFGIFTAITLIAVISILSSIDSGTNSVPTLIPGQATADQICQSMVGQSLQSTLTGQNLNEKVVSESDAAIVSNLNASGNEVATCTFTLDTGMAMPSTVTLFANGSIGMHGGE
jgi:hypothetical protein